MTRLDLGAVSAYAMAKEKGYQGTEEEFAVLMAESGENALAAAASAKEAADAAAKAAQDAADGVKQAVADDATKAEEAATLAQSVKDSIPEDYAALSEGVAALTEELESKLGYVRGLTSDDDLNDLPNGAYRWTSNSVPQNSPTNTGSVLLQYGTDSGSGAAQIIVNGPGAEYIRFRTSTDWTPFRKVVFNDEIATPTQNNIINDMSAEALSGGELWAIPTTGDNEFVRYTVDESGAIVETNDNEWGTDYMKCPKYLLLNFCDSQARMMLYFYDLVDGEFIPRWDLLKFVTSDNVINYIGRTTSRNRIIEIPDGVYMRVSKPVDGDVKLYGWSGVHIGTEMAGTAYAPNVSEETVSDSLTYGTNYTGITIPGNAKMVWLKHGVVLDLIGVDESGTKTIIHTNNLRRQVVTLPEGYLYFRATVALKYHAPVESEVVSANSLNKGTYAINLNDEISCLCDFTIQRPFGRARQVLDYAKEISEIEWQCKKTHDISNRSSQFKEGVTYSGIPYASSWQRPCYFGWHVTKHTFLNAANDPDSVFYTESGRNGGSGYGSVCSAFATLCAGWPNPVVTRGFLRDPHVRNMITNSPQIGEIMYDGGGHTVIPETTGEGKKFSEYTLYESVSPVTLRRSQFDFIDNSAHNTRAWSYINPYVYSVHHDKEVGYPNAYNITDAVITNGSARPNRGDRSVYTSNDDVLINIKNTGASVCYVQRCAYDADTAEFTSVNEAPISVAIPASATQISLDKSSLKDGGFYGVYTNADSKMEYFEYRNTPEATYSMTEDNFVFDAGYSDNLLAGLEVADKSTSGVVFDWTGDECHIAGNATGTANCDILVSTDSLPNGFEAGKTYSVILQGTLSYLRIYYYSPNSEMTLLKNVRTQGSFTLPEDATGIRVRLAILSTDAGKDVDEVVAPAIYAGNTPWYSVWWQDDVPSGITEIVPFETSGDYGGYRKVYNPAGADGVMFFKGKLGAYTAPLTYRD